MRSRNVAMSAAGATTPIYVEDVFSSYLYDGIGTTQNITNGIDLSTYGGLVWMKGRSYAGLNHMLTDSARGVSRQLWTNTSGGQTAFNSGFGLTNFLTNGFTLGTNEYGENRPSEPTVSWTFRKAQKFFDIVTYTGTGVARSISHNLGSTPGMIIIKCNTVGGGGVSNWKVYHKSLLSPATNYLSLNLQAAYTSDNTVWNSSDPTSTVFYVGSSAGQGADVNSNGSTYVAYLFADNAGGFGDSGSDSIIKCGSFTGNPSAMVSVDLGWEPQFLLMKNYSSSSQDWILIDNMRGFNIASGTGVSSARNTALNPNQTYTEAASSGTDTTAISSSGFSTCQVSGTYVYMAIRRGPMKTPTDATTVYSVTKTDSATVGNTVTTNFPVDMVITGMRSGSGMPQYVEDRLRGVHTTALYNDTGSYPYLSTASTNADANQTWGLKQAFNNTGFSLRALGSLSQVFWSFRRARGFFDITAYTGTGSSLTINHNLGVTPEMIIGKPRNGAGGDWYVYAAPLGTGWGLKLNSTVEKQSNSLLSSTSSTTYTLTNGGTGLNLNTYTFVNYLFATCPGVSKVGSYTGTGTTKQIDCGFTNGARFVMIKRTDFAADWYVWDSARGIIAGNDPYLPMNTAGVEVTNTDYIDPYSPGFELSSTAPAALNANGGIYIFLAIA